MTVRGRLTRLIRAYWRQTQGAVAPIVALFTVLLVGISGFAIDIGHMMWVQRQLQSAADAAALAGAVQVVDSPSTAIALANSFSATGGDKNAFLKSTVTTSAVVKCYTSVTFPACTGGGTNYNAIQVTESTDVPMWFSQILGIKTSTVTAVSTASAKGGSSQSLDIVVILDNTASMGQQDNNCTGGTTRVTCAKYGVQQLLNGLNPSIDKIAIMVFPGYTSQAAATSESTCSPSKSKKDLSSYQKYSAGAAPFYLVTGSTLDNTFKSSSSSTTLANSSPAVIAAGGGTCGNSGGVQPVGGEGTYYAQAILAAEQMLKNDGNPTSQKVIVFLSDGDATASSSGGQIASNIASDQCQQAVAASKAATDAGMWVYTVAYGASTTPYSVPGKSKVNSGGSCQYDTSDLGTTVWDTYPETVTRPVGGSNPGVSACWTIGSMASDTTKFYSDDASGCVGSAGNDKDLSKLFKDIAVSLTMPRLIPNNST